MRCSPSQMKQIATMTSASMMRSGMAHFQLSLDHCQSATYNFLFTRKHWRTEEIIDASLHLHIEVSNDQAYLGLLEDF